MDPRNGTPQMVLHKLFSEIEDKKKAVYKEGTFRTTKSWCWVEVLEIMMWRVAVVGKRQCKIYKNKLRRDLVGQRIADKLEVADSLITKSTVPSIQKAMKATRSRLDSDLFVVAGEPIGVDGVPNYVSATERTGQNVSSIATILKKKFGRSLCSSRIICWGVLKIWRLSDYRSTHANTSTLAFSWTMPCKCFLHILRFLHFIKNEDATVDKTRGRYRSCWTISANLSVKYTLPDASCVLMKPWWNSKGVSVSNNTSRSSLRNGE